jgi:hypothetical protein
MSGLRSGPDPAASSPPPPDAPFVPYDEDEVVVMPLRSRADELQRGWIISIEGAEKSIAAIQNFSQKSMYDPTPFTRITYADGSQRDVSQAAQYVYTLGEQPVAPNIETLLNITDDAKFLASIHRLKWNDPNRYKRLQTDLMSNEPSLVLAAQHELTELEKDSDTRVEIDHSIYEIPRIVYERYNQVKSVSENLGMQYAIADRYMDAIKQALVSLTVPDKSFEASVLFNSVPIAKAEFAFCVLRLVLQTVSR